MTREHDERSFTAELPAATDRPSALSGADIYFGKYDGLQGDALYAFEVPDGWDGDGLIMWTRGYGGENLELGLSMPGAAWRQAVIDAGYAWAASSYSANWYDARAGIEDTNKLALNVVEYVERDYGERFSTPGQYLISGASLGGHVAAASVDRENMERTQFKVDYAGAAPLCQSEQNQFQWLGDYPRVMMELSGYGNEDYSSFPELVGTFHPQGPLIQPGPMVNALFDQKAGGLPDWSSPKSIEGQRLMAIAENLTGGERPIFEFGFDSVLQSIVLGTGGSAGDINGILARNGYGNEDQVYRWTNGPQPTAEEIEFNERIARVSADPDANPLREDGVRWIPLVNGDFDVPVLTMHTLGDFYVPFRHQQLYRERARENGNDNLLVQRAIRAPSHCDFSAGEYQALIDDWLTWVNGDVVADKPEGDEVLDPVVVADDDYGCRFTVGQRPGLPACPL
ncbi:alpha/beta hydrolase [Pseudomonas sp. OIL-1]|uniref:alpha/beta hydrolase n=1 Tax=Pseudomonas sp. OIL-1 TaxID=2706126 RepID=UPI0013A7494B|nr:alpha/beta hydrolase [Pseudomonas sp. OIL-1]QIB51766.1 alpha/beta hydrolase [Pseudomonas sp. OIL-1]